MKGRTVVLGLVMLLLLVLALVPAAGAASSLPSAEASTSSAAIEHTDPGKQCLHVVCPLGSERVGCDCVRFGLSSTLNSD